MIIKLRIVIALLLLVVGQAVIAQETLAVFPFTATENGNHSEQLGKEVQQFIISYIVKKQKHFKVKPLNARDVNVALHKAGVNASNMDDYTSKELAEIVGADYILLGSIDKTLQGSTSTSGGFETKTRNGKYNNSYGSSTSITNKRYHANVYISIFKKDGTADYDGNKGNVFIDETPDSWKNSVVWMMRHFPFYN
jgi:hypothetical protein